MTGTHINRRRCVTTVAFAAATSCRFVSKLSMCCTTHKILVSGIAVANFTFGLFQEEYDKLTAVEIAALTSVPYHDVDGAEYSMAISEDTIYDLPVNLYGESAFDIKWDSGAETGNITIISYS